MLEFLRQFKRDRRGATAVEYGLILALLIIASMVAMMNMAQKTTNMWNNVATAVLSN